MRFYLGTHEPGWLGRTEVDLFVSARRLRRRVGLPRASGRWALDSGGFSELSLHGRWETPPETYAAEAQRWREKIGGLNWAAPQDWMCEPWILAKTGLTLAEHQDRTVASLHQLRRLAPEVPWIPVLQGWHLEDYLRCADLYRESGIDLAAESTVGLGSVCRRQGTGEAERIVRALHGLGLRLHGFGFKVKGLERCGHLLASADSLAWSFRARKRPPLPGCKHKSCANCLRFALRWREQVISILGRPWQQMLALA